MNRGLNLAKPAALALAVLLASLSARAAFVYDTGGELLTSGDFNGDSLLDFVVLDKSTGNARVGYLDGGGNISWSAPLVSGVENATGVAAGPFLAPALDSIAVTGPGFNLVNLVSLANSNAAPTPVTITPAGVGPHSLATLLNPLGLTGTLPPTLLIADENNSSASEQIELLQISGGVATTVKNLAETALFDRANALALPPANFPTLATGLVRGDTDRFDLLEFTNSGGILLSLTHLPPGSDYVTGTFTGDTLPRLVLYQTGASNLTVISLTTNSTLAFGATNFLALTEPVQHIFFLSTGSALLQFADGVQALTLNSGTLTLGAIFRTGLDSANAFTGIIPLAGGQFALLDGPTGSVSSTHAQIVKFNGSTFAQVSSSILPSISTRTTRANIWLFQNEPFVNRDPGFISSLTLPDWSDSILSLSSTISVAGEVDSGASGGLGSSATNNLGATPNGAHFGLANQYRDTISVFTYAAPRPVAPVSVTIAPSPGVFSNPILISFTTLVPTDRVFYRAGTNDGWHSYASPFLITNNAFVQYFGTNAAGARSRLLSAQYFLANAMATAASFNLSNATVNPNPGSAPFSSNTVVLSPDGTVFYGRSDTNTGTLWTINLDGSGETYITTGAHPRASRDGRYLAFSRGANVFGPAGGNVWIRDLTTGVETEVFTNQSSTVGYDWDLANPPNLILDSGCAFWKVPLTGPATLLFASPDCNDNFPVVNPIDGRLAFQNLNIKTNAIGGLYVAAPNGASPQHLLSAGPGARWPAWSPDGMHLAYAYLNNPFLPEGLSDIYTVNPDGTAIGQVTGFTNNADGFLRGTIWTPKGDALVGAGSINTTNGLWIIPLTDDGQHCDCPAILLPTSAGDPIESAGSIVVAAPVTVPAPIFSIRMDAQNLVVYWSTNYQGFGLESTTNVNTPASWTTVTGPYYLNGANFEYYEPATSLLATKYFRLRFPTVITLSPRPH